jgi:hypothetical protein
VSEPQTYPPTSTTLRWFSTHHRPIGIQYLLLALASVAIGTLLSLVMRIHLIAPYMRLPVVGVLPPEAYLALVTMHGTLMIFFVLTVAPLSGFANLVLPEQIGASGMAFPRLNAAAFWITASARPSPAGPGTLRSPRSPPPAPARRSAWTCGWSRSPSSASGHGWARSRCSLRSSTSVLPA